MLWKLARKPRRRDQHLVDNGTVGCPSRGEDVDVERCLACPAFGNLVAADDVTYVLCRPESTLSALLSTHRSV